MLFTDLCPIPIIILSIIYGTTEHIVTTDQQAPALVVSLWSHLNNNEYMYDEYLVHPVYCMYSSFSPVSITQLEIAPRFDCRR